MSHCCREEK